MYSFLPKKKNNVKITIVATPQVLFVNGERVCAKKWIPVTWQLGRSQYIYFPRIAACFTREGEIKGLGRYSVRLMTHCLII